MDLNEISGALGVLILILAIVLLVSIFVLIGKLCIANNLLSISERKVARQQEIIKGFEERVAMQESIIKNLSQDE